MVYLMRIDRRFDDLSRNAHYECKKQTADRAQTKGNARDRNGSCKLKAASSITSLVHGGSSVRRRLSSIFSPCVDDPRKQRAKGSISPFVGSRVPCFHYTYVHGRSRCRVGVEGAGVAPRRATMPACTDARMCRVLHAFFTSLHTHARTYTTARNRTFARRATFPPSTGVYPSCVPGGYVVFYIIVGTQSACLVFWHDEGSKNMNNTRITRESLYLCARFLNRCEPGAQLYKK